MFYTNRSIRLHNKCLAILDLIQQSNNRAEDKRSLLARYDACKRHYEVTRLMHERYWIVNTKERYERLSQWLVNRYIIAFTELTGETTKRLLPKKETVSNNEIESIQL